MVTRPAAETPLQIAGIAGDIAEYHAWIGDAPGTIAWLNRSMEFSPVLQFLARETATYDRVREDPYFRAGIERILREVRQRLDAI